MDWFKDFESRFGQFKEIQALKSDKFHGSLELNFNNGSVINYNLKLHRRFEYPKNQPINKEVKIGEIT